MEGAVLLLDDAPDGRRRRRLSQKWIPARLFSSPLLALWLFCDSDFHPPTLSTVFSLSIAGMRWEGEREKAFGVGLSVVRESERKNGDEAIARSTLLL
jgi:hypothetical protein